MRFRLARSHEAALNEALGMSPGDRKKAIEALSGAKLTELVGALSSHHGNPPAALKPHRDLLVLLATIVELKTEEKASDDEVLAALFESANERIPKLKAGWDGARGFLKDGLSKIKLLPTVTKAAELLNERERVYCDGKILTDVRPVFKVKVEEGVDAAFILHTLRIAYHDEKGEFSEFFLSIDSASLDELQALITRAKAKEQQLKAGNEKQGTPSIII